MKKLLFIQICVLGCFFCKANVRLPRLFGDNMVLQRGTQITVWGWADPGEALSVEFDKQSKQTKADRNGRWVLRLDAEQAGGPFLFSVQGKNKIVLNNVMVGEVWVCSGQSNMEMPIAGWGKVSNYEAEMAAADYPLIRQIKVPNEVASKPQDDISPSQWKPCTPKSSAEFTAAGYFFARELYKQLHIAIGLINSSWGGTMIETWISRSGFEGDDEFRTMIATMPAVNLDSLSKALSQAAIKSVEALQGPMAGNPASGQWPLPALDDSRWPVMKLPGMWEQQGLGLEELDGVVWFRREVELGPEDTGKESELELCKVDDSDETYVNGVKVGETQNQYNTDRHYKIPPGLLKPGKNVIAVRVEDTGGGGGIYGEATHLRLSIDNKVISLSGDWHFRVEKIQATNGSIGPNSFPTLLYNAMISPLIPFGIKGVIWYQGEANAGRAFQYRKAFPLLISDWRKHWGIGDFPFYFVQLATFNEDNGNSAKGSTWAELREAQAMTLNLPNTGMAVTTDIGNPMDIHPKNKQEVGRRLSLIALDKLYAKPGEYSGPVYQSMQIEGSKVIISFTHTDAGLLVKNKYGYVMGFEIAGADRQFHYAKAYLSGDKVIVYQEQVTDPVAVRYGWADDASDANLFNQDGLPAAPFRTDQWKSITESVKYNIGL